MILFNYCRGTEENHKKWINPRANINVLFRIWTFNGIYYLFFMYVYV